MRVPDALVSQFYVAGSLRNTAGGWALEARNALGDGTITGVGPLTIDGIEVPIAAVRLTLGSVGEVAIDAEGAIDAAAIDRFHPLRLPKGAHLTIDVRGEPLAPGEHLLGLRLIELNLGALTMTIRDRLAG